jgi:hypothetical protein
MGVHPESDGMVSHGSHLTKPLYNGALPDSRINHNGNGRLGTATPATGSGSRTPAGDDWELNCEICHQQGINLVSPPIPKLLILED